MIVARLLHRKATRALSTVRDSAEMSTVCETLVLLKTTPALLIAAMILEPPNGEPSRIRTHRGIEAAALKKAPKLRQAHHPVGGTPTLKQLRKVRAMAIILWIIAALLVISGIFAIFRKQIVWGIILIVIGCLVGPGGVSIFT